MPANDTVADETAEDGAPRSPADADEVEAGDDEDADVAGDADPAAEGDDITDDDDAPTRVTATDARDQTTEAYEPDDDEVAVGDDTRAHEVRAAPLGARRAARRRRRGRRRPPRRELAEARHGRPRGAARAVPATAARGRGPRRERRAGARAAVRTRTESRVRHGATIAAGRTPAEVWTLRIGAAIVVAILLTAFVLLLAYLA